MRLHAFGWSPGGVLAHSTLAGGLVGPLCVPVLLSYKIVAHGLYGFRDGAAPKRAGAWRAHPRWR